MTEEKKSEMSFLQHLESLRWHLVRSAIVIVTLASVIFCYKEFVFGAVIFGPMHSDFLTYRALCKFLTWLDWATRFVCRIFLLN